MIYLVLVFGSLLTVISILLFSVCSFVEYKTGGMKSE